MVLGFRSSGGDGWPWEGWPWGLLRGVGWPPPPGSYIHAADFGGPRELAEYLTEVASNQTLYASFFEWKKDYSLVFDLEDDIRWSFEMAQGDSINAWCKVKTKFVHHYKARVVFTRLCE